MFSTLVAESQSTISGRVLHKESRAGIPNLLVVLYGSIGAVPSAAPPSVGNGSQGQRLGSVITGADGSWTISVNPQEKRPDLHVSVFAPEEPGKASTDLLVFSSILQRLNADGPEQYIILLSTDQLSKPEIPVPSEILQDFEQAKNVADRLSAMADRQLGIATGAAAAAKKLVEAHRSGVVGKFSANFKPALTAALSKLAAAPLNPDRYVAAGESVFAKHTAMVQNDIQQIVNSDDPAKRAPARGFTSLTTAQVALLAPQVGADGTVPASAVAALATANGNTAPVTYVQALDRLPLCRPSTPSVDCTDSILNPTSQAPVTPPVPGNGVTAIADSDIPRFLARLMDPLTAPEEELVVGLMPVATRDTVQNSVQSTTFTPSPADVPTFQDLNNLQIAFGYVWQEAIDQGALDLAQNAYETIVGLGGDPDHTDYQNVDPIRTLQVEGTLVLKATAAPDIIVRDHRNGQGSSNGASSAPGGVTVTVTPSSGMANGSCAYSASANVRDHRTVLGDPSDIEDPAVRLPALLDSLDRKLKENYNFTIYAANEKERSVNFGILTTYRQIWTPLSYQAGPLVKTIPLAPKQTQKLTITRKKMKKRAQKEVENNLQILKEDSSQTTRAEQDVVNKSQLKSNYSVDNQASGNYEIASDTMTTKYGIDLQKNSDDTKKTFRESVFKASQEVKHERTTEITTEETGEFESVETTEISNPNDEIAVTFLFYELQRRYRMYERLYRVQPLVLVAQEFPQPGDIDQAWLVRHDWILKRAILDDSFVPTLEKLPQTAGDEIAIDEMRVNVNQQRCIVEELRQELAIASQQATMQRALMDQAVYQKSGASGGGILGSIENVASDVVGSVSNFIFGGSSDQNNSNRQALQERADDAADQVRDLTFRLEREVTALNSLTESYTKALAEHYNHLTEIARLQVHVKDNIMYYMQAIWTHEPPDQRFFRLHNTPVPDLTNTTRGFRINFANPLKVSMGAPHEALPRFGGNDAKLYPVEGVAKFDPAIRYVPLSEVADVSNLLGFKGNYAIFPLYQSNALTDFMMDPYIDRATGQLVDPSDPLNWSLDEFCDYVCCLQKQLSAAEFETLRPQLQSIYNTVLTNPARNDDVLVIPTNSLFIEALPAEHTLLERFKLDHRMIDVKKAQAEAREKELDNVRMAARILAGERGDPHIDKKVLVEGGSGFVIPVGDQ